MITNHKQCDLREQSWRESCARIERKLDAQIDETIRLGDALNTARAEIERLKSLLQSEQDLSTALNNEVIELTAKLEVSETQREALAEMYEELVRRTVEEPR